MRQPKLKTLLLALVSSSLSLGAAETVLFEDNFDANSSSEWDVFGVSQSGEADYSVDWAYDYSSTTYGYNGVRTPVGPAPGGGTTGVRLQVNKLGEAGATGARAALNLYPRGEMFSGDYALRFDMFINYNGGATGGTGSTEHALFGLNHTGDLVNWDIQDGAFDSDGVWFAVDGEAGAGLTPKDFVSYEGLAGSAPFRDEGEFGGFLDRNGNGTFEQEYPSNPELAQLFPSPPFETVGAPGKQWVQMELRQQNGVITWLINGYVIAEKVSLNNWTEGNIMIGLMDVFPSIANPKEDNFVIFDNLRVVDLTGEPARPRLTLAAGAPAAEPSTDGSFTITREGDTSTALNVALRTRGTAVSGEDYAAIQSVTIPAGATSFEVVVDVLDDVKGEVAETVLLDLVATGYDYEVFAPSMASLEIIDDADTTSINITAADPHSYELFPEDTAAFRVSRVGDASGDLTVNFTLSGTAQAGTHFQTVPNSVVIPAGESSALVTIVPIDDSVVNENRTVTLQVAPGAGYAIGTQPSATATIRNDDIEPGTSVLFAEDFDDESGVNWAVNPADEGSNSATFQFNYGALGIPQAPNSEGASTLGLKLEANNGPTGVAPFTGISVSPLGQEFTGNFRMSFDMWINFPGPLTLGGTGSTMMQTAAVGTFGDLPQFPGTSVEGVLFAVSGDGQAAADYRAYISTGAPLAASTGVYAAGTQASAQSNLDAYYSAFGGRTAPDAHLALFSEQTGATSAGAVGFAWHEVTITKVGDIVTWAIDNYLIATVNLAGKEIGNNISLGFFDINATQAAPFELSFGLVDNLTVEALGEEPPTGSVEITGIAKSGNNVVISFDADPVNQTFTVLGSPTVDGDYAPEAGATFTQVGSGAETTWQATVPMTADNRFFIVQAEPLQVGQ